jgi:hypothetical protein
MKNKVFSLIFIVVFCCFGCQKNEIPCKANYLVIASSTPSHPCIANGTIKVMQPNDSNFLFKLNEQGFQKSSLFNNVKVGIHKIMAMDINGCIAENIIAVDTIQQGEKFKEVLQILTNRCATCHSGNNPHGGINFTQVCDILKHWDRIQARAVFGMPSPMPQSGLIPVEERNKIINWINAGHLYTH